MSGVALDICMSKPSYFSIIDDGVIVSACEKIGGSAIADNNKSLLIYFIFLFVTKKIGTSNRNRSF